MPSAHRKLLSNLLVLLGAVIGYLTSACTEQQPALPPRVIQVFVTETPLPPSSTPSPTPTPTRTPTPTATAIPIEAAGDPRSLPFLGPTPEVGAYCGFVDTFDFPLDPPDAGNVRGGQDFGVFRERYGKFHAGEDWGIRGGGSLGAPVHAIGHGTVTYASGNGWGLDLGVVIIRHHFPDGSTLLSFYGHLDPPSVILIPGQCIERGGPVGNIGDPSSSPHLHFEIRTTMPHVPGPGYWSIDPTTAGWLPPSETIWEYRMSRMPGFRWQNSAVEARELLGDIGQETFLAAGDGFLAGLYTPGGGLRWLQPLGAGVYRYAHSPVSGLIYTITASGRLAAYAVPADGQAASATDFLALAWEATVPNGVAPVLAPLPGGGIAVLTFSAVTGYDPGGAILWSVSRSGLPVDHLTTDRYLLVASAGDTAGVTAYDETGPVWSVEGVFGEIAAAGEAHYLLAADALYRLQPGEALPERIAALPGATRPGEIVALRDGRVLVLHTDLRDRRLLLFNEDVLVWERSISGVVEGGARLFDAGGRILLVVQEETQYQELVRIYRVGLETPNLVLVFEGGTRLPGGGPLGLSSTGDGALLIRFGEQALVAVEIP